MNEEGWEGDGDGEPVMQQNGLHLAHEELPFLSQGDLHAELCFLYWFHDQILDVSPGDEYRITWYLSWSSCCDCAEQVARFLATHRNLCLAIFSARLYYFWDPYYQEKLRRLTQEGAQMVAMDYPGEGWALVPT